MNDFDDNADIFLAFRGCIEIFLYTVFVFFTVLGGLALLTTPVWIPALVARMVA